MKRTKKTKTKGVKVVLDTFGWVVAFELDADSRCGGEALTYDR
jgi:hypothetical protein